MKVSVDFDNTLSREDVQNYAKNLLEKGIEVFVVTARFNELRKSFFKNNPTNNDLWAVCNKIGIPERNVIFCNMEDKYEQLVDTNLVWHLDDCWVTINEIISKTKVPAIDVTRSDWKNQCDNFLFK